jgi:hypothetical protein
MVDWKAHERAFRQLTRFKQISLAKLIHNLANTNCQNHLYYKSSALCPGCKAVDETFEHVLICSLPQTTTFRGSCLQSLANNLRNKVCQTVVHEYKNPLLCRHWY